MAFFVFVASRDWTGGRVAHPAAALHAVIRCGRGEAAAAEPFDRALVLGGAFRRRVGMRAAVLFFVTLGTVSSSDWHASESRRGSLAWPLRAHCRDCYAARGPYTRLKIGAGSRRCKPEVETK